MNEITMIPVDQLIHHPHNPRLDLGDLTELTESIRSQGVLQNLTVVPEAEFPGDDHYLVVIGNRRMEAAKLAGLAEVPCVISDMDFNTQIATMLTENMHRTDLTLYEQAQGIQMMMDLGLSQADEDPGHRQAERAAEGSRDKQFQVENHQRRSGTENAGHLQPGEAHPAAGWVHREERARGDGLLAEVRLPSVFNEH